MADPSGWQQRPARWWRSSPRPAGRWFGLAAVALCAIVAVVIALDDPVWRPAGLLRPRGRVLDRLGRADPSGGVGPRQRGAAAELRPRQLHPVREDRALRRPADAAGGDRRQALPLCRGEQLRAGTDAGEDRPALRQPAVARSANVGEPEPPQVRRGRRWGQLQRLRRCAHHAAAATTPSTTGASPWSPWCLHRWSRSRWRLVFVVLAFVV